MRFGAGDFRRLSAVMAAQAKQWLDIGVKTLLDKSRRPTTCCSAAGWIVAPWRRSTSAPGQAKAEGERWRYPEGLLLKHARLLIGLGNPLEDVAETIGSRPDDLRRVLEVGIAISSRRLLGGGRSRGSLRRNFVNRSGRGAEAPRACL
jgi:hypothetical protein